MAGDIEYYAELLVWEEMLVYNLLCMSMLWKNESAVDIKIAEGENNHGNLVFKRSSRFHTGRYD